MELKILVDNMPSKCEGLVAEHGFSLWMEVDGLKWLVDCGASDAFALNAEHLGIDIADVDYLILSHGHSDHCGGLETFLSLNNKAQIFLSSHIGGYHYYSTRRGTKRDISLNHLLITENRHRFIMVDKEMQLSQSVGLFSRFNNSHPMPLANNTLLANDTLDDFCHEIAVTVTTSKGSIIISPCSHNGMLNTLDACAHLGNFTHYIGGTHLVDDYESEEELLGLATSLKECYPSLTLISGHCTGIYAKQAFQSVLNDKFIEFYTGFTLIIE